MTTYKSGFNVACLALLSSILAWSFFKHNDIVLAQAGPQSFDKMVRAKRKHFIDYQQDFVHFGQSSLGTDEYQTAMDLEKVAEETVQELDAVHTLLEIYGDLSCQEDRARVRPLIENDLGYYSKMTEPSIEGANLIIAHTQMPGIAAEGTRMRDELREVKSIFESIKLR
jgi:hypothetical protein